MKLNSIKEVYFLIPSPTKSLSKTYNGSGTLFLGRALSHIWGKYYFKYLHTNFRKCIFLPSRCESSLKTASVMSDRNSTRGR